MHVLALARSLLFSFYSIPFPYVYAQQHPLFSFLLVFGLGLPALFVRVDCLMLYLWIYRYTQRTRREPHRLVLGWAGSSVCYETHMYGAAGWLGALRVSLAMGCMYR